VGDITVEKGFSTNTSGERHVVITGVNDFGVERLGSTRGRALLAEWGGTETMKVGEACVPLQKRHLSWKPLETACVYYCGGGDWYGHQLGEFCRYHC